MSKLSIIRTIILRYLYLIYRTIRYRILKFYRLVVKKIIFNIIKTKKYYLIFLESNKLKYIIDYINNNILRKIYFTISLIFNRNNLRKILYNIRLINLFFFKYFRRLLYFFKIKQYKFKNIRTKIDNEDIPDLGLLPPPPIWSRLIIWTLSLGSLSILIWSIFTRIDETIIVPGQLTTLKPKVIVSARDPGVIGEIFILPNQKVFEGDLLIKYDDDETILRINNLQNNLIILNNDLILLEEKYAQKENQLLKRYEIESIILEKYQSLFDKGVISEVEFLKRKLNLEDLSYSLKIGLSEEQTEKNNITKKIASIKTQLLELFAKQNRFSIRSPITGYILDLKYQTPGERIRPDEELVTIIPEKDLKARVNIPSRLRAPIYLDMEAVVEVDAFPVSDYGAITSRISSLSPTSTADKNSNRSYVADMLLIKPESPDLLQISQLRSGMSISAKIKLRKKPIITSLFTVFSKLLDPISEQS